MSVRHFDIKRQAYGDGLRPMAQMICGECGLVATINAASPASIIPDQLIQKKFIAIGWRIGNRAKDDMCPACVEASKTERKVIPMTKNNVSALAPAPRQPTRDEQRIVFEKLNDVYVNENTGYSPGWSDQKVATDLGVARKWIEDIRTQFFGPVGTNPEMVEFLKDYDEVIAAARPALDDARKLRDELDRMVASPIWNDIPKIADRMTRLERVADQLRKLLP